LVDRLLIPAIQALTALGEYSWPRAVWGRKSTFRSLNVEQARAVLGALVPAPRLDWDDEEILTAIAEDNPKLVVDMFSARLEREREPGKTYDAVPFQFSSLDDVLINASEYVIDTARSWYSKDSRLFMFRGGRLVGNVFAKNWSLLETELRRFLDGDQEDIAFILQVLRAYEGEEFLHPLLKDVVERLDAESDVLRDAEAVLDESGVVVGEFGFVELYQQRRDLMKKWLEDPRQRVRDFAEKHIRALENRIAAEQQRAQADYELRKRNWGSDENSADSE
jgi:hypothetical protein